MNSLKQKLIDLLERSASTFIETFVAGVTASTLTDVGALKIAAVAGGYAVLKYLGVWAAVQQQQKPPAAGGP